MQTLLRGENDSKQLDEIQAKVAHGLYKGVPLPGLSPTLLIMTQTLTPSLVKTSFK